MRKFLEPLSDAEYRVMKREMWNDAARQAITQADGYVSRTAWHITLDPYVPGWLASFPGRYKPHHFCFDTFRKACSFAAKYPETMTAEPSTYPNGCPILPESDD